jgi:hypothetical protein
MQVSCYRNFYVAQERDGCRLGIANRRMVDESCTDYSLEMRSSESTLSCPSPGQYVWKRIDGRSFGLFNPRYFGSLVQSILSTSTISKSVTLSGNQTHAGVKEKSDSTDLTYRSFARIYGLIQRSGTFSGRPTKGFRLKPRLVGSFIISLTLVSAKSQASVTRIPLEDLN